MKVSFVSVLAVIFALERSLIWLAPVAIVATILGVFVIAQRRHPIQNECGPEPRIPRSRLLLSGRAGLRAPGHD